MWYKFIQIQNIRQKEFILNAFKHRIEFIIH